MTAQEARLLVTAATQVDADPLTEPTIYAEQVRMLGAVAVPRRLADAVRRFDLHGTNTGILVLRGLDVGAVPPTPPDNTQGLAGRCLLATQAALVASLLGHQISYSAEGFGHLWQDMVPSREKVLTQTSQGSGTELEAHTEQAFSPLRPDHVVLACLRGDPGAKTYVFPAKKLVAHLSPEEVDLLRQPLWCTTIDDSFKEFVPDPDAVRGPLPILSGDREDPAMVVDQDLMHGVTPRAQALLKKVIDIYVGHRYAHVLEPGDVLALDNRAAMHGRSVFRPRFDGGDRFIARGFVVRDLHVSAHARQGGRIVGAQHS
ncbi:TauD/TfdA family dioxygenase [Geodermatophilus normandii]|uniref:TauD/TfdA family dioxygenase n=1 Tax=Geodermatophilus normandii TaxID=1137989 RepID=UPI001954533C